MKFECTNCFATFDTEESDDYEDLEDNVDALLNLPCPNCEMQFSLLLLDD